MSLTRRTLLAALGATTAAVAAGKAPPKAGGTGELSPITADARPIAREERAARLAKVQGLMQQQKIAALLVESGSTLEYFTGVRWHRSERVTAAVIPAHGGVIIVTPFFESPSIQEMLQVDADIRPWKEDENPFALLAAALREHGAAAAPAAIEPTTRYFILNHIALSAPRTITMVPGTKLVDECRMIKSPAELALLQSANNVTLAALRHVHGHVQAGMHGTDLARLMEEATTALGGVPGFSLTLLNEASAFPHGSQKPQQVHEGSVILMDCGCSVHGYESDISRTWVFGTPTARQREVWGLVKRGQELTLESAKLGVPVGSLDVAVRKLYEQHGWSKDYGLPGLSHRTGHGIGMDTHESPYLVRSDTTPLAAGMCFSDEPGIYIPGEFGIRLEDCWHMTEQGPKPFTPLARSIEQPI
jgi:Xaa-Pro dipeptidase